MDILRKIYEATSVGNYPDDGSTGIASDDDLPPGNIVFGDKYKKTNDYYNRLTSFKRQFKPDLGDWYWDEFENSTGMEDPENYSDTLDSMEERWPNIWKHVKTDVPDAERRADLTKMKKEIPDEQLGDEPTNSAEEYDESILINKINDYLNEGIFDGSCKIGSKRVTMPVVAKNSKEAEKKFTDMVKLHQKNGHLPKGEIEDIKFG